MTEQEKVIALVLYKYLYRGVLLSFDEALSHSSGEPISFYGNEIPILTKKILKAIKPE